MHPSRQVQSGAGCGARARAQCRLQCSSGQFMRARPSTAASSAAPVPLARATAAAMAGESRSSAASMCSPAAASRAATTGADSITCRLRMLSSCAVCEATKRAGCKRGGAGESSTFEPTLGCRWTSVAAAFLCLLPVRRCLLDHRCKKEHLPIE